MRSRTHGENDIDVDLPNALEILAMLSRLDPTQSYLGEASGDKGWMTASYGGKSMCIYLREDGSRPSIEIGGPTELDGGWGITTLQMAQRALEVIFAGGDPEDEVRDSSSDWKTYREYEGID